MIRRLLQNIGLFCRISSLYRALWRKRRVFLGSLRIPWYRLRDVYKDPRYVRYTQLLVHNIIIFYSNNSIITIITLLLLVLVGSLKIRVSFAECRLFYRALLQKRPMILRSLGRGYELSISICDTLEIYPFSSASLYYYDNNFIIMIISPLL